MKLSQRQVAALWIAEGGNPAKADEWSAIIMGESGGDTGANENNNPNSCCHGLAQLNVDVHNATLKCAYNPVCATATSIKLSSNGTNFTPWGAYTDGSYRQYLGKSGHPISKQEAQALAGGMNIQGATKQANCGGSNSLKAAGAGAVAGGVAGSVVPFAGTALGAGVGGAIGAAGGLIGNNLIGGCSPLDGVPNPLSGIDSLAAAVEAIARLVEELFTAHFWVRFGKGLLGALLLIYALQGILKATLGMELPVGAANAFLKSKGLKAPPIPVE